MDTEHVKCRNQREAIMSETKLGHYPKRAVVRLEIQRLAG